jgi:PAS domain S-box-containing protein
VHGEDGRILEANEGAVRMYGVSAEVLKTMTAADITDGEDAEARVAEVLANYRERGTLRFDWRARRRSDGFGFDVEIFLTSGAWFGKPAMIAVVRDVTERRGTERSLRERTAELERFERLVVGRELKMIELKRRLAGFTNEAPDA